MGPAHEDTYKTYEEIEREGKFTSAACTVGGDHVLAGARILRSGLPGFPRVVAVRAYEWHDETTASDVSSLTSPL